MTDTRQEVWLKAWCAASASGRNTPAICGNFADKCLELFEKRFLKPGVQSTESKKYLT